MITVSVQFGSLTMAAKWRSLMRLSCLAAATLVLSIVLVPARILADIVLDEFNSPAIAASPAMEDIYVETLGIGALNARRQIRIAGSSAAEPSGFLDSDITYSGKLTAYIQTIERTNSLTPITGVQFNYFFDPSDISQAGMNDAILLDFVRLTGDVQPTFLRAIVFTATSSYELRLMPLVSQPGPHTLAMPFNEFRTRAGVPGLDPMSITDVYFDFFFLGHHGQLDWRVELDRIRFGSSIVPEPSGLALCMLSMLFLPVGRWSRISVVFRKESGRVERIKVRNRLVCSQLRGEFQYSWSETDRHK